MCSQSGIVPIYLPPASLQAGYTGWKISLCFSSQLNASGRTFCRKSFIVKQVSVGGFVSLVGFQLVDCFFVGFWLVFFLVWVFFKLIEKKSLKRGHQDQECCLKERRT